MKKRANLLEQDQTIREMADRGCTRVEMAAATGSTPQSIGAYMRKNGIPLKSDRSRWRARSTPSACQRNHETVKAMAEAGATLDAIGAAVGTTKNRVREYLTKQGLQRPAWREPLPGRSPMARRTEGALNSAWNGGRTLDKDGYVLLWMPEHPEANRHGQVREHRIVMERMIGRPLRQGEVVDHRNDIRDDNRPSNLRLFATNGEHLSTTLTGRKSRESRGLPPSTRKKSGAGDRQSRETTDRSPE